MEPISDTDRLAANHDGVLRGNHKSAALHPSALRTLIHDDVNRGYTLPITVPTLLQMKDSVWSPMGVVHQSTIDEHGAIVPKSRGTHDQTFQPTHGKSVNDRISSNKLVDCTYGYTLRRILHAIVAYRLQHPHVPILISKIDFDKAYRRVHVSASLAAASCFTFDDISGINLPMNFGNKRIFSWSHKKKKKKKNLLAALLFMVLERLLVFRGQESILNTYILFPPTPSQITSA